MAQSYRSAQGQRGDEEGAWRERERRSLRGERRGLRDRLGGGEEGEQREKTTKDGELGCKRVRVQIVCASVFN